MNKKLLLLPPAIFILIICSMAQLGYSIGLAHGPLKYYFEPNGEVSIAFQLVDLRGDTRIDIIFEGDMANYATKTEPDADGRFIVTIKMPATLEPPGAHGISVVASEVPLEQNRNMIATLTAIRVPVKIVAPYPGKYLELTGFSASNANIGEDANFVVSATSWGTDVISSAKAKIDVYDFNEKYLTSVDTDEITDIQPEQEVDLSSVWNTAGMTRGVYSAKATITYDGTVIESDKAEFRVGELLVSLVNYTTSIELGGLKPMTINIKNEWSAPISNVYATVTLNNAEFKTAPVDMRAFENGVLSAYIDTTNFKAGTTPGKLSLYYGDNKKSAVEDIAVTFVEPQKTSEFNMIYVVVILLVIIIFIMLLLFLRKGKNEYKKRRR